MNHAELIIKEAGIKERIGNEIQIKVFESYYTFIIPITHTSKELVDMCRLQSVSAILYEDHVDYKFIDKSNIEINLY